MDGGWEGRSDRGRQGDGKIRKGESDREMEGGIEGRDGWRKGWREERMEGGIEGRDRWREGWRDRGEGGMEGGMTNY